MKTTLNPFENSKRIASSVGGGSVTPTDIERLETEIEVIGSANSVNTSDIADIKAQLTDIAHAYSTTEHKTGRKWLDGRDIYEITITLETTVSLGSSSLDRIIENNLSIDTIIDAVNINGRVTEPFKVEVDNSYIWGMSLSNSTTVKTFTIQYVKTGA